MIFVTFGTQPHSFEYLGSIINQISEEQEVIVQIGETPNNITQNNAKVYKYMENFHEYIKKCDVLITHGGVGSIMDGLKLNKKVIAVSRLVDFGEHVDNHQLEITTKLAADGYIYHLSRDEDINQAISTVLTTDFMQYQSNTRNFVSQIENILRGDK